MLESGEGTAAAGTDAVSDGAADRIRTRCGRCLRGRGCELIRRRIGKGIVCMLGSGSESARLRGCLSLDVRSDGIRRGRLGRLGRCLLVSGLTEVVTHW